MLKSTQSTTDRKFYVHYLQKKIPFLYPDEFHGMNLHQEKTTSHTSKNTTAFIEKLKIDANIECILFHHIPAKLPDV